MYIARKCPQCKEVFDTNIFGISTTLGPALIICDCGQVVKTNRREFVTMDWFQQIWFVLMSLVAAVGVGFWGCLSLEITRSFGIPGGGGSSLLMNSAFALR